MPHYTEYFRQNIDYLKPGLKLKEKAPGVKYYTGATQVCARMVWDRSHSIFSPHPRKLTSVSCDMCISKISHIINDIAKKSLKHHLSGFCNHHGKKSHYTWVILNRDACLEMLFFFFFNLIDR